MLIVIAPRLYLRLLGERTEPPLGAAVWENTLIEFSPEENLQGDAFRNILDGSHVTPYRQGEHSGVLAADALANFPVAVLHRAP